MNGLAHSRTRVLLADGDALARAQLAQLLAGSTDITIAAAARTVDDVRAVIEAEGPELVITEVELQDGSVLPLVQELSDHHDRPRILILSADSRADTVLAGIAAGADGYVLKEHASGSLQDWVTAALGGQPVLDQALVGTVFQGYRQVAAGIAPVVAPGEATLSTRARDVLELMAAGLRNRDIADRLGLSEHTVKVYVAQVFAFLGVSDRTAAVMQAIRRGLVRPPLRDVRNLNGR